VVNRSHFRGTRCCEGGCVCVWGRGDSRCHIHCTCWPEATTTLHILAAWLPCRTWPLRR
jgi:hypothetical protein